MYSYYLIKFYTDSIQHIVLQINTINILNKLKSIDNEPKSIIFSTNSLILSSHLKLELLRLTLNVYDLFRIIHLH